MAWRFVASIVFLISIPNKIFSQYFLQTHINSKNGLPQNTINDIAFDKHGFVWLATEDGIVRYDGANCKVYNSSNSGLKTNRTEQFIKTENGDLYCTMDESDLYKINEVFPKISIQFIRHLNLYETTKFQIPKPKKIDDIINYNQLKLPSLGYYNYCTFHYFPTTTKEIIYKRYVNGLLVLNKDYKIIDSIGIKNVWEHSYYMSQDELIGFHAKIGFYRIGQHNKILPISASIKSYNKDSKLLWDEKENKSYFINDNTIYAVQLIGTKIQLDTLIKQADIANITDICISNNKDQIIIGTLTNGVYLYNKIKINTIASLQGDNNYYAQAYSKSLKAFVLTFPLQILSSTTDRIFPIQSNGFKFCSYLENDSILWTTNNDTLYKYHINQQMKPEKIVNFEGNRNGISIIARKNETSFYIVTNSHIYLKSKEEPFKKLGTIPYNNKYKRNYTLLQDGDSLLWIASHFGLHKYHLKSNTISHTYLKDTTVRALYKTTDGHLFVGTYGNGWFVLSKHNKLIKMPADRGKSTQVTHSFIHDASDNIWLTTNNGLFKIAYQNILQFIKDTSHQLYYYKYSEKDGLSSSEFNGGCHPTHVQLDKNSWSLQSNQGLVQLDVDQLKNEVDTNALFIDEILLDNTPLTNISPTLDLPNHNFKLDIYLATAHWNDYDNLIIDYQLSNEQEKTQWITIRDIKNPIIIKNLKGGTHDLVIRKRNIGSSNEFQYVRLKIHVPKIYSEQIWFYPLLLLAIIIFAYLVSRIANYSINRRKEKLKQLVYQKTKEIQLANQDLEFKNREIINKNETLEQEAKIKRTLLYLLGHDIATPLRFVNLFLDHQNVASLTEDDILDVKISVKNIQILLDNLMAWLRKVERQQWQPVLSKVNVNALIEAKIKLFDLIIRKRGLRIKFEKKEPIFWQTDQIICSIAIQNLLGNAINHSKNDTIEISYHLHATYLELIIENNGSFFSDETINSINANLNNENSEETLSGYGIGLKITNELLKLINGKIIISNTKNGAKSTMLIYE